MVRLDLGHAEVDANCREVIDNVVDMAHFFYIHFALPTYFRNVFEGHVASQYLNTRSRPDIEPDASKVSGQQRQRDGHRDRAVSEASYTDPGT